MPGAESTPVRRYGVSVFFVVLATLLRLPLNALLGESVPFILYFPAVMASAWFEGLGAGLLAAALSALAAWYFFIPPNYSFSFDSATLIQISLFLSFSSFISFVVDALQKAKWKAEQSEEQSTAQKEQFHVTLSSIGDAVITTDTRGRVTFMNAMAETLTGWKQIEAEGRHLDEVFQIISEKTRQQVESPLVKVLRETVIAGLANYTILIARDGTERPIDDSGAPIRKANGKTIGAVLVFRDITERKRAEREREEFLLREHQARNRAEEASRLKDEFLAIVSHELRTPLNAILGWARMLKDGSLTPEVSSQAIEVIVRNANLQAQLIEDLLDVSRIISGKLRLDVRPVEMTPVIRAALDSARPAADAREIKLQSSLNPHAGPVRGDAGRLQQIVWNLLSNAIKFTPKGGRVQVTLSRINSHVEIVISDTGQGIKQEFLPHVFDRFRQADATSTRTHGGLGLGLAIVRHLVELHGGTVSVESPGPGQGATFTVKLPLTISRKGEAKFPLNEDRSEAPTAIYSPSLDGIRVLVVDDEADTRLLLTKVLEECSAEVRAAASASDGLAILKEWEPGVIVSDIGMPGEDGYAFIEKVRRLEKTDLSRVPAVALTAYARSEDRLRALASGYHMHVAKPVEPMELIIVVANLVGRSAK